MLFFISLSIFVFGTAIGSFLNVLIDRLPNNKSINGRSHCDYCGKKINWFDMFPVVSYFILGAKTRCCNKKLSFQYPLIEFITGVIFVLVFKDSPYIESLTRTVLTASIMTCLIVIFVSDLKYQLISDYILLALFVFSVLFRLGSGNPTPTFLYGTVLNRSLLIQMIQPIISGLIVGLPIFLIYFISKERAMGLGDVYLAGIMGFLLGWEKGLLALYIAFITGAIYGVVIILLKNKKLKSKIAFGPFLVIGTVTMLFWGEKFLEFVRKIYHF